MSASIWRISCNNCSLGWTLHADDRRFMLSIAIHTNDNHPVNDQGYQLTRQPPKTLHGTKVGGMVTAETRYQAEYWHHRLVSMLDESEPHEDRQHASPPPVAPANTATEQPDEPPPATLGDVVEMEHADEAPALDVTATLPSGAVEVGKIRGKWFHYQALGRNVRASVPVDMLLNFTSLEKGETHAPPALRIGAVSEIRDHTPLPVTFTPGVAEVRRRRPGVPHPILVRVSGFASGGRFYYADTAQPRNPAGGYPVEMLPLGDLIDFLPERER